MFDILNRNVKYEELFSMLQLNQTLIDDVIRSAKINNNEAEIQKANNQLQRLNKNKQIILNTFIYQFENENTVIPQDKK